MAPITGLEPLTEHRLVSGPIVYGYLRLTTPNPARRSALTAALTGYCDRHELVLAGVFTDHHGEAEPMTPAFVGLLDALLAEGSYGGRSRRRRPIWAAGAWSANGRT